MILGQLLWYNVEFYDNVAIVKIDRIRTRKHNN
jgi:hypothetical protein